MHVAEQKISASASWAGEEIAVIGMAGRFPGAGSVEEFWENLRNGVESITRFSDAELRCSVLGPEDAKDPDYVKAGGVLDGVELFDASFFGLSAREAEITDPQHRLFLECACEAMESAGHDPGQHDGSVGVFASAALNGYLLNNLLLNPGVLRTQDLYQLIIANDKDFLATRVSHALNLRGPSLSVQTACSSSLVAVHLACQSLIQGECDMALAGGVSIRVPQREGHLYRPGGLVSPDGHTRAFDAKAAGTLFSSGLGIVVLTRLADAVADGDTIRAVIKGCAINNDGSAKTGYTAPSLAGQMAVITKALDAAGVDPETITYVEAHGTATLTGDPTEIDALTQVFRSHTPKKGFCGIGTVKTNVGHLNTAAGVAGLIKTVLSLEHRQLPASLHFERPNPEIDFAGSPFYVNRGLTQWHRPAGAPRRAAVNSLGIGGTNACAIVEEAPAREPSGTSRSTQLLMLSARTVPELETATQRLASHLERHPETSLADGCYTLKVGRRAFRHRRIVSCRTSEEAVAALRSRAPERLLTGCAGPERPHVVFIFPGQGSEHINMALNLFLEEPDFRETIDRCAAILQPELGVDPRDVIYPSCGKGKDAARHLASPTMSQLSLFMVSYALAKLWMRWGIQPDAVCGHSTGEITAGCVAGVFSLEDALRILSARGRLSESLPPGAMLVVALPEEELRAHLGPGLSLAVVGGPSQCVASGLPERVRELERKLRGLRVACKVLPISRAYHSEMIEPTLAKLGEVVGEVELKAPSIPLVSTLTGTWASEELTHPAHWVRQFRQPVHFFEAVSSVTKDMDGILLEVGPGQALSDLVRRASPKETRPKLVSTCRHERSAHSDVEFILKALGRLWLAGVPVDWRALYAHERRHRFPLPTYPFTRQRYWIEPQVHPGALSSPGGMAGRRPDIADWFYVPSWRRLPLGPGEPSKTPQASSWLVFLDEYGLGTELAARLEEEGNDVTIVTPGERFGRVSQRVYSMDPRRPEDHAALATELSVHGGIPPNIVHMWSLGTSGSTLAGTEHSLDVGYYSLLSIAQALAAQNVVHPVRIHVVSGGAQVVTGKETLCPESAALLGPCTVIPQEYPNITCRIVDVEAPTPRKHGQAQHLLREVTVAASDRVVAYRGDYRWVRSFEPIRLERRGIQNSLLRPEGVYLITGGLGGIGLLLAEHLAHTVRARLVLVGRSGLPPRADWPKWLSSRSPEDRVSRRIQKVQELEAAGAEMLVLRANAADEAEMREALDKACERFGAVHGVLHAAGVLEKGAFASVTGTGRSESEAHFEPKVRGLIVLEKVLQGRPLDFCLLFSSISSILGGLGYCAYSAANAFMDAFVQKHNQAGTTPWISANWDTWRLEGAAAAPPAELAMTPEEGLDAFERILTTRGIGQIVVSTGDLDGRLERWVGHAGGLAAAEPRSAEAPAVHDRPELLNQYVPPADEVEGLVAGIWQELLGISRIGIHDNFFELGGHSLLATQVTARLRNTFRADVPITALFDAPTIAGLAALVRQCHATGTQTDVDAPAVAGPAERPGRAHPSAPHLIPRIGAITRVARRTEVPLSYAQQMLWLLHQVVPDLAAYNIPTALRVEGPLNVPVLGRALDEIVCRHEALRTTFLMVDGCPVQVVAAEKPLRLVVVDLTDVPEGGGEKEALRCAAKEAAAPMSLTEGPLVQAQLFRLRKEVHVFLLVIHHMVFDGWSLDIFFRELGTLYEAFSAGKPSPLPGPPVQFADFTLWQRGWLKGETLDGLLSYWLRHLAAMPSAIELPSDRPRPPVRTFEGARHWVRLPGDLCRSIEAFSRGEEATLFMTLLGAFQTLLFRHTGQTDQVLGSPIAGRNHVELEGTIGCLMDMLILRNDLSGDPTFRELLKRVRASTLAAYAHQNLPMQILLDELRPEITMSHMPLFQTVLMLQNMPGEGLRLPGLEVQPIAVENGASKFDLSLIAYPVPDGFMLTWEYSKDLFDRGTVERLAGEYQGLLEAILFSPDRRLSELPMSCKDK